jgi:hypothetical protein
MNKKTKNGLIIVIILIATIIAGYFASQLIINFTNKDLSPAEASIAVEKAVSDLYGSSPDITCDDILIAQVGASIQCEFYENSGKYNLLVTVKSLHSDGTPALSFKSSPNL